MLEMQTVTQLVGGRAHQSFKLAMASRVASSVGRPLALPQEYFELNSNLKQDKSRGADGGARTPGEKGPCRNSEVMRINSKQQDRVRLSNKLTSLFM
ncbi:hypothetical protein PoB_006551500 [Plakobranchus ocellatus]|uniref:Uncharacterized protein n=1 Tax=Plakobranchus ocellatus TaxID=259542 RepID=A0AAV4D4D1_9GAST|nr:hypothetical protein PoB_006551500 [Plakobranchus ocellatus]